jgi:CTP:phosphocholine cytidylyltransferase-like protein
MNDQNKQNEIAILMAAGLGSRMRPLTEKKPKPLISVGGSPMIETVIRALEKRGVSQIYVVVGYLGDQFGYLTEKYDNITIVRNEYYEKINNISSIHAVTDVMRGNNVFICEADLYIPDPSVLNEDLTQSCYFGRMVEGHSDDWVFDQDDSGRITRIGKGGDSVYNMCGISYFLEKDATTIADAIDDTWGKPGYEELFWDEVVHSVLDKADLTVHPIENGDIVEIDTVDELHAVEEMIANK